MLLGEKKGTFRHDGIGETVVRTQVDPIHRFLIDLRSGRYIKIDALLQLLRHLALVRRDIEHIDLVAVVADLHIHIPTAAGGDRICHFPDLHLSVKAPGVGLNDHSLGLGNIAVPRRADRIDQHAQRRQGS